MKKADKKVNEYLERAHDLMDYLEAESWDFAANAVIEIAKMIQKEENKPLIWEK